MFKRLSLKLKLLTGFLLAGILPILIFAGIAISNAESSLKNSARLKLEGIKHLKAKSIKSYFSDTITLIDSFARTHMIIVRLNEYYADNKSLKEKLNIYSNKVKHLLKDHNDIMSMGFQDVFVIDKEGFIIYTEAHKSTMGKNVIKDFSNSSLAEGYKETLTTSRISFKDFKYYKDLGESAAFIITPLLDFHNNNNIVGALAVQISIDKINEIMNDSAGLGETGETYLIGSDGLLRANSRLDNNLTVNNSFKNKIKIKTEAVKNALAGTSETKLIKNNKGIKVLSSYEPINIQGNTWVISTEVNESEALGAVSDLKKTSVIIILLSIATIISIAIKITNGITKPINNLVENIDRNSSFVASTSTQLKDTSLQLAEGSTEQASSIEEISSTLEQTSSMVSQNSKNTQESVIIANEVKLSSSKANTEMQDMMESMEELKKSSNEIAKIIKVIDEIAFQTNILALNAAVEAARAGDAGLGFAIVAEEVRNLAQKSAQAAKDTADIIENNVNISEQGVDVSKKVKNSLDTINNQSQKVSSLLEEVAEASQEQTQGISQINKAISAIDQVIQTNASNAEENASTTGQLFVHAESMKTVVNDLVKIINGTDYNNSTTGESLSITSNYQTKSDKKIKAVNHNLNKRKAITRSPSEIIPLNDDASDF